MNEIEWTGRGNERKRMKKRKKWIGNDWKIKMEKEINEKWIKRMNRKNE